MNYLLDVLKKYAVFKGRARRTELWMFILFYLLIVTLLDIIGSVFIGIGTAVNSNGLLILSKIIFPVLISGFYFGTLVPTIAVIVRRLHDTGRSGWWCFIAFVPFIGGIIIFVFCCMDSEPGTNNYGPNPKEIV